MRLPRTRRISTSDFVSRSSPSKRIWPATILAAGGSRRRMVSASVLLPEPDSPTTPSVLPGARVSETSSTARSAPGVAGSISEIGKSSKVRVPREAACAGESGPITF